MDIRIEKAQKRDTPVLRQLYELYCYDFSVYTQSDVSITGLYTDDTFLTDYWREPDWSSYLVRVDAKLAGFAWVLQTTLFRSEDIKALGKTEETRFLGAVPSDEIGFLNGPPQPHYLIEEFFIMRKYRLKGLGEYVADYLFDLFPGIWEVSEMVENTPAQTFWRKVIDRYSGGKYVELTLDTDLWRGPVQVFRSRRKAHDG